MTDPADTPDPDLEQYLLDQLPEDPSITIPDPSPELRELMEIAQTLNHVNMGRLVYVAQFVREQQDRTGT